MPFDPNTAVADPDQNVGFDPSTAVLAEDQPAPTPPSDTPETDAALKETEAQSRVNPDAVAALGEMAMAPINAIGEGIRNFKEGVSEPALQALQSVPGVTQVGRAIKGAGATALESIPTNPQSLMAMTPLGPVAEQNIRAFKGLNDWISGRKSLQDFATNDILPETIPNPFQWFQQAQEVDKTPPGSYDRWKFGMGTIGQLAMAAGIGKAFIHGAKIKGGPNAIKPSNAQMEARPASLGVEERDQGNQPPASYSNNVVGAPEGEAPGGQLPPEGEVAPAEAQAGEVPVEQPNFIEQADKYNQLADKAQELTGKANLMRARGETVPAELLNELDDTYAEMRGEARPKPEVNQHQQEILNELPDNGDWVNEEDIQTSGAPFGLEAMRKKGIVQRNIKQVVHEGGIKQQFQWRKKPRPPVPAPVAPQPPAPSPKSITATLPEGEAALKTEPSAGAEPTTGASPSREEIGASGGQPSGKKGVPEPGKGITKKEVAAKAAASTEADARAAVASFEATGKIHHEDIAAVRGHIDRLEKIADQAERYREDHPDDPHAAGAAEKAQAKVTEWQKKLKPMQTEWSKAGEAQQQIEFNPSSLSSLRRAFMEIYGKEPSAKQVEQMRKWVKPIRDSEKRIDEISKEMKEELDKGGPAPKWSQDEAQRHFEERMGEEGEPCW